MAQLAPIGGTLREAYRYRLTILTSQDFNFWAQYFWARLLFFLLLLACLIALVIIYTNKNISLALLLAAGYNREWLSIIVHLLAEILF
jgi:hypothetical protein